MTSYGGRFVTRSRRFRCAVSSEGSGLGASHRLLQAIESGSWRPVVSPALALEYKAHATYKLAAELAAAENVNPRLGSAGQDPGTRRGRKRFQRIMLSNPQQTRSNVVGIGTIGGPLDFVATLFNRLGSNVVDVTVAVLDELPVKVSGTR